MLMDKIKTAAQCTIIAIIFIASFMLSAYVYAEGSAEDTVCGVSRTSIEAYKERITPFVPVILTTLRFYNVDENFVWLAMIESGGDPNAVSSKGAAGLWQLTEFTAHRHGCQDRLNVVNSTQAAVKYIAKLNKKFHGDAWETVVGYNMGGTNYIQRDRTPTKEARALANTVTCLMREMPVQDWYKETGTKEGRNDF